jgi:peptidoglycan/xylan/chitin deacetylase (PgdA/CDA1 family)
MRMSLALIVFLITGLPLAAQTKDSTSSPVSIYLTFDDGPMPASQYLAEAIQRDSIPVTVFLVGRQVSKNITNHNIFSWYRGSSFVEIANHSFTHAKGRYRQYYQQPRGVVEDILLNEDTLNISNKTVRLPGRNVWRIDGRRRNDLADAAVAADTLAAKGYDIFGWDLEWCFDTSGKTNYTAAHMLDQVRFIARYGSSFTRDHIVILCHDPMLLHEQTRQEFALFIKQVKTDPRFIFRLISAYPAKRLFVRH